MYNSPSWECGTLEALVPQCPGVDNKGLGYVLDFVDFSGPHSKDLSLTPDCRPPSISASFCLPHSSGNCCEGLPWLFSFATGESTQRDWAHNHAQPCAPDGDG